MTRFDNALNFLNNVTLTIYDIALGICTKNEWGSTKNFLPFNMIYCIEDGEVTVETEGISQVLTKGKAYLITCNKLYNFSCQKDGTIFYLHFNLHGVDKLDLLQNSKQCIELSQQVYDNLLAIKNTDICSVSSIMNIKSVLYKIFSDLKDDEYANINLSMPSYNPIVIKVFNYINQNLCANLTVNEIAKSLGYNANYLSKIFYSQCNLQIKNYISTLLYQKAMILLSTENYTIKQVAQILGFNDQFYFSKFFKKYHLSSPSNFIKSRRKND